MNITSYALNNRAFLKFLLAILLVGGIYAFYKMSKMEDPEINVMQAIVVATYPGATPYEIELEVADPIERSIMSMPSVKSVQSKSMDNFCMMTVELETTTQSDQLQQEWDILRRKVNDASADLPQGASKPIVLDDFGDVYGMFFAVTFDGYSTVERIKYMSMIERHLKDIEGVGQISVYGNLSPTIDIEIEQSRLASLGILPSEILLAVTNNNNIVYAGQLESGDSRYKIDIKGRYRNKNDIGNTIIKGHEGEIFKLSDIATIKGSTATPVRSDLLYDGAEAVGISVAMKKGYDITKLGKRVMNEIDLLDLPAGIKINKVFYQPDKVSQAINQFVWNLILSVIIVIAVLMFTMGWRTGAVIGLGLIITVLGSVMILGIMNGTLQRVSLGAFIIVMGMLVDNAIVVADGILVDYKRGFKRPELLTHTANKTAWPLLGATIIAILAFFPIALSPDVAGQYVRDLFIVLCVSLLLSWLLALTQIPFNMDKIVGKGKKKSTSTQNKYQDKFGRAVAFVLTHKSVTLIILIVLLIISGFGFRYIPQGFFPNMVYDQLYIEYQLDESKSSDKVKNDLKAIEDYLRSREGVKHVTISTGGTPTRYNLVRTVSDPAINYGELIVDFDSPDILEVSADEIQEYLNTNFPEAYARVKRYNLMYMQYPVEVMFTGPDPAILRTLADEAKNIMKKEEGAILVTDDWKKSVPSVFVAYNDERAAQSALSRNEIGLSLLAATDGVPVSVFYDGQHRIPLIFKIKGTDIESNAVWRLMPNIDAINEESVKDLLLGVKNKGDIIEEVTATVPIDQVSDSIGLEWRTPIVRRYNGSRAIKAQCNMISGLTAEQVRSSIAHQIEGISLPEGYKMKWQGEYEASNQAKKYLFGNVPMAIVLMILILIALFKDYRKPLIIILCLPLAFIGIVAAMLISGKEFGFVAIVGTLGLIGMMIKNGVVLIDEITSLINNGTEPFDALVEASMLRFRPVMMASFTTILGMIPLIWDDMFGSMAVTIMGGLFVGTLITLIVIPLYYSLLFGIKVAKPVKQ